MQRYLLHSGYNITNNAFPASLSLGICLHKHLPPRYLIYPGNLGMETPKTGSFWLPRNDKQAGRQPFHFLLFSKQWQNQQVTAQQVGSAQLLTESLSPPCLWQSSLQTRERHIAPTPHIIFKKEPGTSKKPELQCGLETCFCIFFQGKYSYHEHFLLSIKSVPLHKSKIIFIEIVSPYKIVLFFPSAIAAQ